MWAATGKRLARSSPTVDLPAPWFPEITNSAAVASSGALIIDSKSYLEQCLTNWCSSPAHVGLLLTYAGTRAAAAHLRAAVGQSVLRISAKRQVRDTARFVGTLISLVTANPQLVTTCWRAERTRRLFLRASSSRRLSIGCLRMAREELD